MTAAQVQAEIDRLSHERQEIWAGRAEADAGRVERIGHELHRLYEEKRSRSAEAGSPEKREKRMRSARVDQKLEALSA